LVVRTQNLLVKCSCVLIFKWQIATKKRKENHTTAPNIAQVWNIALSCDHLWRSIAWRAACRFEELPILKSVAETKVNDLDIPMVVKQEILRLEVSMNHIHSVDLLNAREDLMKEPAGVSFSNSAAGNDVIEKLATTAVLHD
jgi:hypothetical protein